MIRYMTVFLLATVGTIIIDQNIKSLFVDGLYHLETSCIDLELHYNRGVAFSMFSFLGDYLKWIQLALIIAIIGFVIYEKYIEKYPFAIGLIIGGAISNLYDRFIQNGVVDYVAWHCGFNFAVFNYADVMIDLGVAIILITSIYHNKKVFRSE